MGIMFGLVVHNFSLMGTLGIGGMGSVCFKMGWVSDVMCTVVSNV